MLGDISCNLRVQTPYLGPIPKSRIVRSKLRKRHAQSSMRVRMRAKHTSPITPLAAISMPVSPPHMAAASDGEAGSCARSEPAHVNPRGVSIAVWAPGRRLGCPATTSWGR